MKYVIIILMLVGCGKQIDIPAITDSGTATTAPAQKADPTKTSTPVASSDPVVVVVASPTPTPTPTPDPVVCTQSNIAQTYIYGADEVYPIYFGISVSCDGNAVNFPDNQVLQDAYNFCDQGMRDYGVQLNHMIQCEIRANAMVDNTVSFIVRMHYNLGAPAFADSNIFTEVVQ